MVVILTSSQMLQVFGAGVGFPASTDCVRTEMTAVDNGHAGIERTPRQLAAEFACRNLIHAFADHIDQGAAAKAVDLFTDDAEMGGAGQSIKGRDAIGQVLAAREANTSRRTRHQVTNVMFELTSPETAVAQSLLCVFVLGVSEEPTIGALSEFRDEFACDGEGRWRFARREATILAGSR
jgi:uncharacterized protein (TIGR02246 family)